MRSARINVPKGTHRRCASCSGAPRASQAIDRGWRRTTSHHVVVSKIVACEICRAAPPRNDSLTPPIRTECEFAPVL
jgi:hypothetical protein